MILDGFVLQVAGGMRASVPALIMAAGPFAKAVLAVLLIMSVWSWTVIWDRTRVFTRVRKADQLFLASFRKMPAGADIRLVSQQHPHSILARVAIAGQRALDRHPPGVGVSLSERSEIARRAMEHSANDETAGLERHVGFLATTGSVSPFIGLMGTVWGVMSAFLNIGAQGSASLVVVAPGIAEALIATVAGLAAAIPAVVGYNHLIGRLRDIGNTTAQFSSEFVDRRTGEQPK